MTWKTLLFTANGALLLEVSDEGLTANHLTRIQLRIQLIAVVV
jgi:hypothetical protein